MFKISIIIISVLAYGITSFKRCNSKLPKDQIIWHDSRRIEWVDFKGAFSGYTSHAAGSSVKIKLDYVLGDSVKKFDVICIFFKKESWYVDTTRYLLNHEQGHFDIGEIFARQLRKAIFVNIKNINRYTQRKIDSIYYDYTRLLDEEQKKYDEETLHSINWEKQKVWDKKISSSLDSLKEYKR